MTYNYHTHTRRCGHAKGTEEEYVLRAIQGGIRYMGFSDHMPLLCDDGYESRYRVPMAEAKDYIADIIALREKYRDVIDIKVGFEEVIIVVKTTLCGDIEFVGKLVKANLDGINDGHNLQLIGMHYGILQIFAGTITRTYYCGPYRAFSGLAV